MEIVALLGVISKILNRRLKNKIDGLQESKQNQSYFESPQSRSNISTFEH